MTHAWLHTVDFMEMSGPLWAYWCWVMERMCSKLVRGVSSKRHPSASLDRRSFEFANLNAVIRMYDLQESLASANRIYSTSRTTTDTFNEYPETFLRYPKRTLDLRRSKEMRDILRRIAVHFVSQWDRSVEEILPGLPTTATFYSRIQIDHGEHDIISSYFGAQNKMPTAAQTAGKRDATFMQYELLVDRYPSRKAISGFVPKTFFGRLNRIIVINTLPQDEPAVLTPRNYILLDVDPCSTTRDRYGFYNYKSFRATEVVDATTPRAIVGRIYDVDAKHHTFVRRYDTADHAEYRDPNIGEVVE